MFRMNEGCFFLPPEWHDRSVNIFAVGGKPPFDFSLVISRETLPPGQDMVQFVDEQIAKLPAQLKSMRLKGKRQKKVGGAPALEAELTWQADTGPIHQRQVYVEHLGRVLIFTATAPIKIADEHELQFDEILASFSPSLEG